MRVVENGGHSCPILLLKEKFKIMNKENINLTGRFTIIFGLIMFILGILAGVAVPKYFSKKGGEEFVSPTTQVEQKEQASLRMQDSSQEILQLQAFLATNPENADARVQLGNTYFDSGQWEKAINEYLKALGKNPKDANVRTDLGICYRELGQYDRALEEFKRAAADDRTHVNSRFNAGVVYHFDKKDYKNAKKAWEEYLRVAPSGERTEEVKGYLKQYR